MKIGFRSLNRKFFPKDELARSLRREISFAMNNRLKPIAINLDSPQEVSERIPFSSIVCNPHYLNLAANHKETFLNEFKKSLKLATAAGSRYVSLHAGFKDYRAWVPNGEGNGSLERDKRKENLLAAVMAAEAEGIELLIENNGSKGRNQLGVDLEDFSSLLVGFDEVGILLNVGHANLAGGAEAFLEKFGTKIKALTVSDNDGKSDQHLLIGEGTIDWGSLLGKLSGKESLLLDGWLPGKTAAESLLGGKRRIEQLLQ